MDLNNWVSLGRKSWKEHNPTLFKKLKQAGQLQTALREAAERTYLEVDELENAGFSPQDAWEMTRKKYLLLPPEETQEDEEDYGEGVKLHRDLIALQNRILQSRDETAETNLN